MGGAPKCFLLFQAVNTSIMLLETVLSFSRLLWIKQVTLCSYLRVGENVALFAIEAFKSILQFAKLACNRFERKFEVQILN